MIKKGKNKNTAFDSEGLFETLRRAREIRVP